jgi:hypothetical protein
MRKVTYTGITQRKENITVMHELIYPMKKKIEVKHPTVSIEFNLPDDKL